jgi:molybdenum cofactor cytidylyltransferase
VSSPVVIVLASGKGERFTASGGSGNKLHALLGGKRVIDWTIAAAKDSGLRWHVEDGKHEGMGDCISAAVRASKDATGWLILPGDLPLIQPSTLVSVAESMERHEVVVPHFRGERGHPVGFDHVCEVALLALRGPNGAQSVVRAEAAVDGVFDLEIDDEGIVTDIDTLGDLRIAERKLALR